MVVQEFPSHSWASVMRNNVLPLDLCHTGSSKESELKDGMRLPASLLFIPLLLSATALSFAQSRLSAGTKIMLFSWTTPLLLSGFRINLSSIPLFCL